LTRKDNSTRLDFLKSKLNQYGIYYSHGDLHRWGDSENYFGCKNYFSSKDKVNCIVWAEGFLEGIEISEQQSWDF
tara:strand:+ start:103 stop:327 length:225 start_codon:yes stop_codon:yes gene_type:complete